MNQLWRNQLLGLAIEQDPDQPYKHVTFSAVKHPGNTHLDTTLDAYRHWIADNPKFTVFTSADVIDAATANADAPLARIIHDEMQKPHCGLQFLSMVNKAG